MVSSRRCVLVALLSALMVLAGCPPKGPTKTASGAKFRQYKGLAQQKVAVYVHVPEASLVEYKDLQIHLARALITQLGAVGRDKLKRRALKGTSFVSAAMPVAMMRDQPELVGEPITKIAPLLGGATRVIYLEVENVSTVAPRAVELLLGSISLRLVVVEVSGNTAKTVFEEPGIQYVFPPNNPDGVMPSDSMTHETVYLATVEGVAAELAWRFFDPTDDW